MINIGKPSTSVVRVQKCENILLLHGYVAPATLKEKELKKKKKKLSHLAGLLLV